MNRTETLPPNPIHVLERERLLSRLLAWDDKKLVIIHAQAGQGKSTLAATYAASLPVPAIWYSLDAGDDGPEVFLASLGRALQEALPDRFPGIPRSPRSRYGLRTAGPAVARWIGQVFSAADRPCLIVLDDYHLAAASPALRSVLKTLFEATPAAARRRFQSRDATLH